jgi:glutathione S-transferase
MYSPKLWHISVSHFSEKVRWAFDHKAVEHERRAMLGGPHMALALWLTRGRSVTFPVAEVGGQRFGDSTAIIAALEESIPEPPLYPEDPADRRRALELEDWFDVELGPSMRLLVFHEFGRDRERFAAATPQIAPPQMAARVEKLPARAAETAARAGAAYGRLFVGLRYRVRSERAAELARAKVLRALDYLEERLGGRDYLVGDRFSVADLTAAALLYPVALPPGAPVAADLMPPAYLRFREPLKERPGYRFVEEMYRRHRSPAGAAASGVQPAEAR